MTIRIEFLKLKRSPLLRLMLIAGIIAPLIKGLQFIAKNEGSVGTWNWFLSESQEMFAFCTITALIVASAVIFSMEYQYGMASYVFTLPASRAKIYVAKLAALLLMICLMFASAFLSQLLLGSLLFPEPISKPMFLKMIWSVLWYIFSYFLLSIVMVTVPILTKRFNISAGILLGYTLITFPIHYYLNNPYINPFLTPATVAAKIYNTEGYFFGSYYKGVTIDLVGLYLFLVLLAVILFAVGIICFKKTDVVS